MSKVLLLGVLLLWVGAGAFGQSRLITGTVVSTEDNQPIPGATVLVSGTSIGTSTDLNGNYSITVPSGENVLIFSFIGLRTQEVTIGNRSSIDVALESELRSLSEFVITSYGDQSKREITGAISSVRGDLFQDLPMQSFDRAMQGRIAGVQVTSTSGQPGGAINVRIRGVGSVNAGNEPLYIIDGVQVPSGGLAGNASQNALASINPNDIESIEVLKDAAAGAIYGAQAANGVVLITTRRGVRGATKVRLSAQHGIVRPMGLYDVMNSSQLASLKRQAFINAGRDPNDAAAVYGNPEDPNLVNTDWVNETFGDARLSVYDLSLSGGDDRTTFFLSGSYTDQGSQVIKSDYQRGTARMNLSHRPNQRLTINTSISLTYQESNGAIDRGNFVNSPFLAGFAARPNIPIYNEDGSFRDYPSDHLFGYNIVQGAQQELRLARTVQTVSNLQLNYQFTPWLSFTSFAGVDFSDIKDENNRPSTISAFRGVGGTSANVDRRNTNFNTNHNFNINKKFNNIHSVSGIMGFEFKSESRELTSAQGQGFANPILRYLNNAATPTSVGSSFTQFKRLGIFGQAKYDYDDRYTADFTLRRDGHSRFGSEVRFGTFGAASLGWRLSSESFLEDVSWLDNLRIRASYGITGNSLIPNFASATLVSSAGQYLGSPALVVSQLGNDLLTWEEAETFNIGVDGTFFNGRIITTVDVWRKNSTALLFDTPLPIDSGFGEITRNSGEVRNQGIDFDLQTVNLIIGKFQWSTGFNITFLENELRSLFDDQDRIGNTLIVGRPLSPWVVTPYAGINPANGRPMYIDENDEYTYTIRDDDPRYVGSALPTSYGGLTNSFRYGPVSLEIFFQYQFGNLAFNADLYNLAGTGSGPDNQLVNQLDFWKQPGDIVSNPMPFESGARPGGSNYIVGSTRQLSDGSYIRLKQVTLSYTVPPVWTQKVGIEQANVFVQGLNLATFTKFNGIDPEVNSIGTTYAAFPNSQQISAGINLSF